MTGTFIKELMKKALKGGTQKTTGTGAINTTNISKNLKEFQKHKEDIIKTTDKYTKGLREEGKINVRKSVGPALGKVSKITQKLPEKKAKGGRVGLKSGTPKKKKSQADILGNRFDKKFKKLALSKEAQLHAKDYDAGLDRAERRAAKEVMQEAGIPMAKGGRVGLKGGSNLGMQSVKYGLDNKPEVTKLDRIAKFIAKDKKKKNKKFKTPMDQAVKKNKKNKRFV